MVRKKKYHGGLFTFFLFCFVLLFINCSSCFAYVSQDYVDYALDTLLSNGNWISDSGYSHETGMKAGLNKLKENNVLLKTKINDMLDYYSIPKIDDDNIIFFMLDNGTSIWLRVVVSNCSYPGSYELGFLRIGTNQFSSYNPDNPNNNTDYIYGLECSASSSGISDWNNFSLTGNNTKPWTANRNGYSWNQALSVITFTNLVACKIPSIYTYYPMTNLATGTTNIRTALISCAGGNYIPPQPTPTPTPQPQLVGTITNPSGDITGNINLQPIENSLNTIENKIPTSGDIQNIISGETTKIVNTITEVPASTIDNTVITSGDIISAIGVTPMANPYSNLWTTLLNGFSGSLTNVNRSISFTLLNETYTINLDDYTLDVPLNIKVFLGIFYTVVIVIIISKDAKHITEDLFTASIDNVAHKLTEDFESTMF